MTVGMFGQGSRFFSVALLLYSPLGVGFALGVICPHGLVGLGTHGPNTVIKGMGLCQLAWTNPHPC